MEKSFANIPSSTEISPRAPRLNKELKSLQNRSNEIYEANLTNLEKENRGAIELAQLLTLATLRIENEVKNAS